jgi:hypothetical protein
MGHILVPHLFEAAFGCANRQSCRFVLNRTTIRLKRAQKLPQIGLSLATIGQDRQAAVLLQSDLFVFQQGRFLPMADAGAGTARTGDAQGRLWISAFSA